METLELILSERTLTVSERLIAAFFLIKASPVYLTQVELSKAICVPRKTVERSLLRLQQMGVIKRQRTEDAGVGYRMTPPSEWRLRSK